VLLMTTTDHTIARVVDNYFRLAVDSDTEAYFAQFAPTAVVEDEGHEYHGINAIRSWRTSVPPVRYDVRDVVSGGDGVTTAHAEISGTFPGSPVTLSFRFGLDADRRIELLIIRV
jgi:hypothetical protein